MMRSLPTPDERRKVVDALISDAPSAERVLLRARLYAETPPEGLIEERNLEPKSRCAVCWVLRPARSKWHDQNGQHHYYCENKKCRRLWRRIGRSEERMHAQAQERLVEAVQRGETAP